MKRHQVLTGAVNPGDCCFAVGYTEGVPYTAYASGCDIVILASNFERVQIIPGDSYGSIQVGCIDCSTENGKIAASFANQVYIFEPVYQPGRKTTHKLDYEWYQMGSFKLESLVSNLSWNHDGTRLLTGSDSIQIWACPLPESSDNEDNDPPTSTSQAVKEVRWESVWQTKTATPVYHLKFSSDGQFFASAGKGDRLVKVWYSVQIPQMTIGKTNGEVEAKAENYGFIYLAHPRAVTGFSWRKTSKYLPTGGVANCLVTSCRDNICRVWRETLLSASSTIVPSSKLSSAEDIIEHGALKRPHFSLSLKPRKKRKAAIQTVPLNSVKQEHDVHRYYHGRKDHLGSYLGSPPQIHFHIAGTINPNTDIPLLPAMGTMSKGAAPNFVVNWLNNKELQYTLAAETLLQPGRESSQDDPQESGTATENTSCDQVSLGSYTELDDEEQVTKEAEGSEVIATLQDGGETGIIITVPSQSPRHLQRPATLTTSPSALRVSQTPGPAMNELPLIDGVQKKFESLIREWHSTPDMLYSIHPIDGSFLLWLVEWIDEHIPGVHRQPIVSFSCRIPQAFAQFDATSLCSNLLLYRSNLTLDHRVLEKRKNLESPMELRGMTPSYSFVQKLSQVPEGVDIFAYTPKVSMLSKHSNGTLNQWEISFAEGSKFQTVLNVNHVNRSAGHRFQVNDLACHPILPLLLTSSHHNIPKVDVDPDIATSRTRRISVVGRKTSMVRRGSAIEGSMRSNSISLFGKSLFSQSEHRRLSMIHNAALESAPRDLTEKDEIVIPDEIMDRLNSEMNWPDMSAPTGLCSELILWKVFHVGPLSKLGGVVELARINSPFLSAFSHVAWLPSLLPSTCLSPLSNSPSACFVASDGYSLRLFQAVIDARSLLNEVTPLSNQYEGYLSSSSPITKYLSAALSEEEGSPLHSDAARIISLQSTSRPGCIIELDKLCSAKQNWQNVQLMHIFHQEFITSPSLDAKSPSASPSHNCSMPSFQGGSFDECFYLVVIDRQVKGQSIMHMWYIRLKTKVTKSTVHQDVANSSDEEDASIDNLQDSSPDSSDAENSTSLDAPNSVSQVSTQLCTFSKKVCSQRLPLPKGVEVVSATPAAGHLSSSCIYPACAAPYLLSTACSDGKLRFWTCRLREEGEEGSADFEMESVSTESEEMESLGIEDELAAASYVWEEWKLMVREETGSSLPVPGQPIAISCAYNGRIACAYRTDSLHSPLDDRIPIEVSIHECESTGGSEWIVEDTINLGRLNLNRMDISPENGLSSGQLGYKVLKRSSKIEDFLNLPLVSHQNPELSSAESLSNGQTPKIFNKPIPVQLAWVSKEDGSHLLTVGLGSKVTVFTPSLGEDEDFWVGGAQKGIKPVRTQVVGLTIHNLKPRWLPIVTVKLSTVDGLVPYTKMLSWVRGGILVIGLQNEMHVYSQWKGEDMDKSVVALRKKSKKEAPTENKASIPRNESSLSVNLQVLPMTRSDREQSYNDMTMLQREKAKEESDVRPASMEDEVDKGLFELSYEKCPVLPQYHPTTLMGLMNCGKVNRVNAILSHLVRCIAGDEAVQRAISQGDTGEEDGFDIEDEDLRSFSRSLSLSTSPVETKPKASGNFEYIELMSVPPLPLYALLAADKTSDLLMKEPIRSRTSSISGYYEESEKTNDQDYSRLFATSFDSPSPSPVMFSHEALTSQSNATIRRKMNNPTYFGPGQAKLLANYLTRMHLPGLSGQDQMHLLALADTLATTKTEITGQGKGTAVKAIGRGGAGYADVDNLNHAGETLDDCGLRFLLAMKFYMGLIKSSPIPQQMQLRRQGLATSHFAWAFHSEAEEELLSLLPSMHKGEPCWDELRAMGAGWWVRNNTTLRRCIEKVAKSQFQAKKNPMDSALFYLAMKKKTILWGLFRSIRDEKMTNFFRNDFKTERWRKAALKNAFALLGRQRFEHAAAFFLLAGSLKDAIEVCLNNLKDIQLGMVIARLYEEEFEQSKEKKKIIYEGVLGCDEYGSPMGSTHPDPFLRSMGYWILKDYKQALETLLIPNSHHKQNGLKDITHRNEEHTWSNPDVFNFFNYLRMHPLIVQRQNASVKKAVVGGIFAVSSLSDESTQKDEITPEERRLFFATAHAHASSGCPLLALEVLSKLPKVKKKKKEKENREVEELEKKDAIRDCGGLISSGTIDEGFVSSSTTESSFKETVNDIDWSRPSGGLTNGGDSPLELDWSQPLGGKFEEKLELDWGDSNDDDDEDKEDKETRRITNGIDALHSSPKPVIVKQSSVKEEQEEGEETEGGHHDIMAQQAKFMSCMKVMMEELRTLATGFEVDGGQLRYQLYVWLERQVEVLKMLCNYGPTPRSGEESSVEPDDEEEEGHLPSTLHEIIQARRLDFIEKRQRAVRRKRWLQDNHYLLRTIVNYSLLYGQNGGGLASVCMELVLLMQEVQQDTSITQQLSSPLPLPTTLPLLSASIANSKAVIADPILHMRHLIHSLLLTVLDFTAPPSPARPSNKLSILRSLSAALSACIYQSLCDSDSYSSSVIRSKAAGMDVYSGGSANVLYRVGNLVSVNRKRRMPSGEGALTVSSTPAKWPGVATLQALLSSEKDNDLPAMNIQLCEGLFAVYMSLVVHAMSTHNTNEMYRLLGHNMSEKMWASIFGGGTKVTDKSKVTERTKTQAAKKGSSPDANQTLNQQRNRYTLRLLGKASSGRNPTSAPEEKPVVREVFIPPETSIMDYFLLKPYIPGMQENIDFDSNASDSSDEEYEDEDAFDDMDDTFGNTKVSSPGENEHSDPSSFSWCLMRYCVVKLLLHKIQTFLPIAGIELAELPVASPILHSILKLLEQWQRALIARLDLFARPPPDYIPGCCTVPSNTSGPALLRYKVLLEPSNTPFKCNDKSLRSIKRLWNFLVRQEPVQEVFIRYIFEKNDVFDETDSSVSYIEDGLEQRLRQFQRSSQVRIIHKEQERISAFCFNQSTPTTIVLSTNRGLLELDISLLLGPNIPYWFEEEAEDSSVSRSSRNTDDEFLVMHKVESSSSLSTRGGMSKTSSSPYIHVPSSTYNDGSADMMGGGQTGRGTNIISQRPLYHIRRLAAHPSLPYYLSGSNDGSVHMWEWGHNQKLYTHRGTGQYPKVSQIRVSDQGNKFGVSDDNGHLCLWQMGMNSPTTTKPYWSTQCHTKSAYDFCFLGSSSFLASAGLSVDNKNICLWDTLMSKRKCMVHAFVCHDGGCPCIVYCPRQQTIISGSRKGEICLYDVRQRKLRQTFQAHESCIRSLAVDPSEEFFVSGSAEGNIKVWSLSAHSLLHFFPNQHSKGTFFRQGSTGVLQLALLPPNYLYSCGTDGTMKWRILSDPTADVVARM